MAVNIVSIYVPDPEKAAVFYVTVLEFTRKMDTTGFVPLYNHYVRKKLATRNICFSHAMKNSQSIKNWKDVLYKDKLPVISYEVENVEEEYKRLKAIGIVFKSAPEKRTDQISAIFDDTCGNYIEMISYNSKTE